MKPYSRLIMLPCILAFAAVMAIPGMVYGEARVLSYELDEEQTWTCDLVVDSSWEIDELSASGTHKLEAELTYTVTEDNLDNSYDIDIDQDNGQITVDDVGPDGISTGSDSIVQEDGRGKIVSQFDHELLFPDDEFDDFYFGALAEDEGMFVTTAVDVTDTWTQDLMGTEDSTAETDAVLPFVIMLTMFYVITTTGRHILGSVVEEKSSRIVEVLISHVSPLELITGKLLGLSAIGLAVSGIWFVVAFAGIYMGKIDVTLEPANAVYFAAYFILGFLFLASVMIGIGAACGTDKQARNLAGYVMLILTASIVLSPHVVDQPNGAVATWLSFIPITASTTMMLRLACGYEFVPVQHVVGSLLALVAAIVLSTWVAARIFRTGMLLYGKQASVSEIATWLLRG